MKIQSIRNLLQASGCEVPDWIFSLKNINKSQKKRLEKFPVKRETISTKIEKNIDRKFLLEMKIKDKQYMKKQRVLHKDDLETQQYFASLEQDEEEEVQLMPKKAKKIKKIKN